MTSFGRFCSLICAAVLPACCIPTPAASLVGDGAVASLRVQGVENVYRVSPELYRSGQPSVKGFIGLQHQGIRSVLNLREYHSDNKKAQGTGLELIHYPVAAGELTEKDLDRCLRLLRNSPKPVLVHCLHGSDRTGAVVAAYRIVEQGWTPEKAMAELQEKRFGHHALWYPNISRLLRGIDWPAFAARLNVDGRAHSPENPS